MEHTIDAQNKAIGRVATEVATLLMGKDNPSFQRHIASDAKVKVVNSSKLLMTNKKKDTKTYTRYSGYPGGLKEEKLAGVIEKHGSAEALRRAVYGMLPNNKLRQGMLNNLEITE